MLRRADGLWQTVMSSLRWDFDDSGAIVFLGRAEVRPLLERELIAKGIILDLLVIDSYCQSSGQNSKSGEY